MLGHRSRSVSFDPFIDDDMSSLCGTYATAREGSALRRGKYSQYSPPSKEKDLILAKDLNSFFDSFHYNNPREIQSKPSKVKKEKEKNKSYSGQLFGRCNRSSLIFRRWKEYTWYFAKPSTLILFASSEDCKMYQSSDFAAHQKEKLVKFAINFDTSGKLTEKAYQKHKSFKPPPIPACFSVNRPATYVVTEIKSKVYKSNNPRLHNFKIIRWCDYDKKTVAAFGGYDLNSLTGFHKSLAKCVKRANKATRPKSDKQSVASGSSSIADSSQASHVTEISLWSYYTAGAKRNGRSRGRNKLNKINEQFEQ